MSCNNPTCRAVCPGLRLCAPFARGAGKLPGQTKKTPVRPDFEGLWQGHLHEKDPAENQAGERAGVAGGPGSATSARSAGSFEIQKGGSYEAKF